MRKVILITVMLLGVLTMSCTKENNDNSNNNAGNTNRGKDLPNNNEEQSVIPSNYYVVSSDGKTLMQWFNTEATSIDMQADKVLRNVTNITAKFSGCEKLKTIILPNKLVSLSKFTFYNCEALTSIVIPDGVTQIKEYTFSFCKSLETITLGKSISKIEASAFLECNSLVSVTLKNEEPPILSDNIVFNGAVMRNIYVPANSVSSYKNSYSWKLYSESIKAIP